MLTQEKGSGTARRKGTILFGQMFSFSFSLARAKLKLSIKNIFFKKCSNVSLEGTLRRREGGAIQAQRQLSAAHPQGGCLPPFLCPSADAGRALIPEGEK